MHILRKNSYVDRTFIYAGVDLDLGTYLNFFVLNSFVSIASKFPSSISNSMSFVTSVLLN